MNNPYCPTSLRECFSFDESALNPTPKGAWRKLLTLSLDSRYSMTTLMRLSQYFYVRATSRRGLSKRVYSVLASYLRRKNAIVNHFEHGANPAIARGVVFHHPGVCITSDTVIETGVHIYRNVTFGGKDGGAPHIRNHAKIASHAIVVGPVIVGERSIVGAGAVVVEDVPDGKIVAGVPAKIIGDVTETNYAF